MVKRGKEKHIQIALILIILVALLGTIYFEEIKESVIFGFQTATFAVMINVDTTPPNISIVHPTNSTYNYSRIDLNFSIVDDDLVNSTWYNINNGANISITGNVTLSINDTRSHILRLYANDTKGNLNFSSITFKRVNFTIIRTEFDGETTDFDVLNDTQLRNITNLTLETTNRGKIIFLQNISITDFTNIDAFVDIGINFISLDANGLSNFNKSAELFLYNLTFSNPRILRDGQVCQSIICTKINYSSNVLRFNVTGFTNYSSEETPTEVSGVVSGGGGGSTGGASGGKIISTSFIVDRDEIKIDLKQGETKREQLIITNILDQAIQIKIDTGLLKKFIFIQEENFMLKPHETKIIDMDIIAPIKTEPDLYVGNILISDGNLQKSIITAVEIEHVGALFDVKIDIPTKFRRMYAGEELLASVSIYSIQRVGLVDTEIEYIIKDDKGNNIYSEKELLAVDVQTSFVKSLKIPPNIEPGKYLLYIRTEYDGSVGSASAYFEIIELQIPKKAEFEIKSSYIIIALLIIITLILIRFIPRNFKIKKKKIIKPHEELDKLREHIRENMRK